MTILGAKGLARELLQVLSENDVREEIFLFDDVNADLPGPAYDRYAVIRSFAQLETHFKEHGRDFVLGLGGAKRRCDISEKVEAIGGHLMTLVSKSAYISHYNCHLADGVCVLYNAVLDVDVRIGKGTLVNMAAVISHDVTIGAFCEISPGAKVLGRAEVGDLTEVGANAVILPDVKVGTNCRIGAGAVVTRDVSDGATVVGIPAKPLTKCQCW